MKLTEGFHTSFAGGKGRESRPLRMSCKQGDRKGRPYWIVTPKSFECQVDRAAASGEIYAQNTPHAVRKCVDPSTTLRFAQDDRVVQNVKILRLHPAMQNGLHFG